MSLHHLTCLQYQPSGDGTPRKSLTRQTRSKWDNFRQRSCKTRPWPPRRKHMQQVPHLAGTGSWWRNPPKHAPREIISHWTCGSGTSTKCRIILYLRGIWKINRWKLECDPHLKLQDALRFGLCPPMNSHHPCGTIWDSTQSTAPNLLEILLHSWELKPFQNSHLVGFSTDNVSLWNNSTCAKGGSASKLCNVVRIKRAEYRMHIVQFSYFLRKQERVPRTHQPDGAKSGRGAIQSFPGFQVH